MFLQHWFNLSDPAAEEALYDTPVMRAFAHIDIGRERVPDETTICKFRHKNGTWLIIRCALVNLFTQKRTLLLRLQRA